ncbi:hypothetical protein BDN70DRAFT_885448 [Pholiota conissans]|uniref:Uncharacterized protein n=1 Tax=Pholiota conissans TaxID=109636 RepID=A0A9P5YU84_9AGAR|nr:hypothetical protein BDN70DRAFT_885448 [Pholiota conissans]
MTSVLRCIRPPAAEFDMRSDSLIASEDSFSRHSPYREGMTDTSFPVYCTTKSQSRGPGIYARSTLSLGHGLGVYNIVGNVARPKYHIAQGAFVGDVGYSNDGGTFLHCFNIFYPSDHPIQPESLPPQFTPVDLPAGGIRTIPDHFAPGTVLCSEGIKYTQTSESPLQTEFSTKAREGSVLVLPDGASREELVDKSLMHAYVKEHGASWYRYYNGDSDETAETPVSNGTLRIVTSVDRADAWAIATFPSEDLLLRRRDRKKETHFKYNKEDKFPWDGDSKIRPLDYSFGYASEGEVGAVLLELSSVALSPAQWSRNVAYIPPRCVRSCPVLSVPPIGLQARIRRIIEYLKGTTKPPSVDDPIGDFHPSIIILHILALTGHCFAWQYEPLQILTEV